MLDFLSSISITIFTNSYLLISLLSSNLYSVLATSLWYIFIQFNILLPELILVCILFYKTKPSKESLKVHINSFIAFANDSQRVLNKAGLFQNFYLRSVKTLVSWHIKSIIREHHFDAGIINICIILIDTDDSREQHILIGTLGTWFPIS
jgi:hypothetical protein